MLEQHNKAQGWDEHTEVIPGSGWEHKENAQTGKLTHAGIACTRQNNKLLWVNVDLNEQICFLTDFFSSEPSLKLCPG